MLALGLNTIYLINSSSGLTEKLKIPQVEIRGVSWKDNHTIAYSIQTGQGWQVHDYDINNHQMSNKDSQWAFIHYAEKVDDTLWQNQAGDLFYGENQTPVLDKELLAVEFVSARTFNLKKIAQRWAWQKRNGDKFQLMVKDQLGQPAKLILETDSYHFDLSNSGVLFHTQQNSSADIFQTISQF